MMRIFGVAVLFVLLILLGSQIGISLREQASLRGQVQTLQEKARGATDDQSKLQAELEYFSHPENIEKEIRARFNYKKQGEKTVIIVPQQATSSGQR